MRYIVLCFMLVFTTHAAAGAQVFNSGNRQTVMIELYTSEGCNSCPPAEKFLNTLTTNTDLWKKFVPLAFHVDYWDYLGWQDRYADPGHTQRQKQLAAVNSARTIYTPGFFVNGRSWRRGFFAGLPDSDSREVGNLAVTYADGQLTAQFAPIAKAQDDLVLHVALLGMGLSTSIQAGENAGRFSRHEFVVLGQDTFTGRGYRWRGALPQRKQIPASRYALVAWLSHRGQVVPLQATGGFIDLGGQ